MQQDDYADILKRTIEVEENIVRKQMTWQEEVEARRMIHELYVRLYGSPQPGKRTDLKDDGVQGWNIEKTAKKIKVAHGSLIEDIQLARAFDSMPDLKDSVSRSAAMRELKKRIFIEKRTKNGVVLKEGIRMIFGDSAEKLDELPDASIDCVVTDPPYGIEYKEMTTAYGSNKVISVNKNFEDTEEYALKILDAVCAKLSVKCKDDAHLYFFFGMSKYSEFKGILQKYFIVDEIPLIWEKANFTIGRDLNKNYGLIYEPIFFCKNKNSNRLLNNTSSKNLFKFGGVIGKKHPTEKPVELLKHLISNSSVEGELILDPFAGSFSTLVACKEINRKGIGIERDPDYFEIGKARLNDKEE